MKKQISIALTLMMLLTANIHVFAEETTTTMPPKKQELTNGREMEFFFMDNRLYVKVIDAMAFLGYKKEGANIYSKEGKKVEFDPVNLTVSFENMPKSMNEELKKYSNELIISSAAIEELFAKSIVTKGNTAKFELRNVVQPESSWTKNRMIAHGLGSVNGMVKTNTLDAMRESYKKGYKVFEVDLLPTLEGKLVATPGFYEYLGYKYGKPIPEDKQNLVPTKDEFMSFHPNVTLNPIDFETIVRIMSANKDIYLVTDTKMTDFVQVQKQFQELVAVCNEIDPSVLERIIPQIYNEQMYDAVKSQYNFKSIIYTLYQTKSNNAQALAFAMEKGINVITMPPERVNPVDIAMYNSYGVKVYTHTINTLAEVKKYKDMGVYGFYTDFVTPEELDTLK